jgi:amidohydrolase
MAPSASPHLAWPAFICTRLGARLAQVYGIHNWPALTAGQVGVKAGPLMGSEDNFIIKVHGKGGHGAMPNLCIDPLLVGAHIVTALQSIVSRRADPVDALVCSVTQFNAGSAFNVTPAEAELRGTLRAFDPETRKLAQTQLVAIAQKTAATFGATAEVDLQTAFPPTINDSAKARLAAQVAAEVVGEANVVEPKPTVASEDFAYMLQAKPGCYLWLGNSGPGCTSNLHECTYDFNDDIMPIGASLFAALVERLQPPTA